MCTHVKIHESALLDRAKIVVPKTTKIFGSGTRTGVTGLRRPVPYQGYMRYMRQKKTVSSFQFLAHVAFVCYSTPVRSTTYITTYLIYGQNTVNGHSETPVIRYTGKLKRAAVPVLANPYTSRPLGLT
jgi:hypothetical protein